MKKILLFTLCISSIYMQGTFSGVTYFDYTYDFTEGQDAFALKRVYFTYQKELSEGLSYKFQTDVGQLEVFDDFTLTDPNDGFYFDSYCEDGISIEQNECEEQDCDPDTDGTQNCEWIVFESLEEEAELAINTKKTQFVAYLKNAKIDWNLGDAWNLGKAKITIGLQGMNIFNVTEKTWGFRFLEKSPMDRHGFSSSADMGIASSGSFNNLNYSIMFTNGSGYKKSETDRHKKVSAQFVYGEKKLVKKDGINIGTSFSIEPYDIESEEGDITIENKTVMAFFGGYAGNGLRLGAEFDIHTDAGTDVTQQIIAAYGSYKISDTLEILTYIDLYDPNTKSEDDTTTDDIDESKDTETYVIAGINYYPTKGLTITPNMKFNFYETGNGDGAQFSVNFQFKF